VKKCITKDYKSIVMKKFLYFSAPWCGPCKQLGPIMDELSSEGYTVQKIDVDSNPELCQQFGIRNVPTVVLQVDGIDMGRKIGFNAKDSYISLYNQG
jgi:thioredoxin 1